MQNEVKTMSLLYQNDFLMKIILIVPIIICILISILIDITNGNIIAGFSLLSEKEKEDLRKKGYLKKVKVMLCTMATPLMIGLVATYVVTDKEMLTTLIGASWSIFAIIVILGIITINLSVKK